MSAYGDMDNIRTAMNRGAFDFVTKPVDLNDLEITVRKTLDDIARVRELDRRRAVAERARTNLSRYFSPNLVGLLADRDEPLGPVRRRDGSRAVRRYRGLHPHGREHGARSGGHAAARVSRAHGGADLRLRRHRSRNISATRSSPCSGCRRRAPDDAANALSCADRMLEALGSWNAENASGTASRRWRSASASTTGRLSSAMSAASTACPSP